MSDTYIKSFVNQYAFLSNFYSSPIMYAGILFPTLEHAYQAAKSDAPEYHRAIEQCDTPGQAKRLGQKVKLRDNWEESKDIVMESLVRAKFTQSDNLRKMLLDTSDAIIEEGNTWGDTYWGVCRGKGKNKLGKILMKIRSGIKLGLY